MPRACIVFNLIPVFFDKNVRIFNVTGSILENPVQTRYRVIFHSRDGIVACNRVILA